MGKLEYDKRRDEAIWLFCNECQRYTFHTILAGIDYSDSESYDHGIVIDFWKECNIVQCGGCKNLTYTKKEWDSTSWNPEIEIVIQQFPPKEDKSQWYIKNDIYSLPCLLQQIYKETIQAINNKSYTLAGIGLRAIIETVCKDKDIKGVNLEKKIDSLGTKGYLTPDGAEILHGIRLIGNDAAHDTKAPKVEQINAAMKVIDHLILGIYVIPKEAHKALPKRQKKDGSDSTAMCNPGGASA